MEFALDLLMIAKVGNRTGVQRTARKYYRYRADFAENPPANEELFAGGLLCSANFVATQGSGYHATRAVYKTLHRYMQTMFERDEELRLKSDGEMRE